MNPKFKVQEAVEVSNELCFVFARRLDGIEFLLGPDSFLGEVPITSGQIPRKLSESGEIRFDVWGFGLKNPKDKNKFVVGETLELSNGSV